MSNETDIETLTSNVLDALHAAHHRPGNITMLDLAQSVAEVLASDWLAARDAEHEREVAALRDDREEWVRVAAKHLSQRDAEAKAGALATARAEAAERALADLRASLSAEVDGWTSRGPGAMRDRLRALLPRDDAAGGA